MQFLKITLVGIGQIFLRENGLSGLIIAIAMFFSHWALGVACICGAIIGTLSAHILKFPTEWIKQGLYGFNASLSFMCVIFTFGLVDASNPVIWLLGIFASLVSTIIMHFFLIKNLTALTFPFVLTCWICCAAVAKWHWFALSQSTPNLLDYTDISKSVAEPFYAWAEVNFGSSQITGILLFIAIAISSPMAAISGVAAATLGKFFAQSLFHIDANTLANGIYGFSPILIACLFVGHRLRDFIYILVGVIMAVSFHYLFSLMGLPAYTIGFILAGWILLTLKNYLHQRSFNRKKIANILNP